MRRLFTLAAVVAASAAGAQGVPDIIGDSQLAIGEGWPGFLNLAFLLDALLKLTVAAVLGAIIANHPRHVAAADTLEEVEAPKVYVLYAVIGAIIGILVAHYGLVAGFVLFGIGGLIRFRTVLASANLTGRVIFVTLIGLTCGLNLPHVAVLATAFVFGLVYVIERRATYRVTIQALPPERVQEAAYAYRTVLENRGCRILAERKNPMKQRVLFLISAPRTVPREQLVELLDTAVTEPLRGSVDWETD